MAYEKIQEDQEYEENHKEIQHSKHNNDQFSAVLLNREKGRKRKIHGVQDFSLKNPSKCNPRSQSDKMVQYKMHKSNNTNSVKSHFSRKKVLDWLKSVQSANTQIEQLTCSNTKDTLKTNNRPEHVSLAPAMENTQIELACSNTKDALKTNNRPEHVSLAPATENTQIELGCSNTKDALKTNNRPEHVSLAPAKETDVMSISSDSTEEKNRYSKKDSENKCTRNDKKPWAEMNKRRCMEIDHSSNVSLIKEGHAEKDGGEDEHDVKSFDINFKQSCRNSFQIHKARNNQWSKGENNRSRKRKLPKLTSLTDIKLHSVPNNAHSERKLNYNCQSYTLENIKSKSIHIKDNLLPNIASNIRETGVKVDNEIIISDEDLDFNNKYDKHSKTNFDHKISHSKGFSVQLKQKEHNLFNKDTSACENNFVFKKKENNFIRINSDENEVSCRTSMHKSLENYNTHVHNFCDNENTKIFEESAFSGSESDKTQNFERTENDNNHDCKINQTVVKNVRNIENIEFDRTPTIIDNKNNCIILSDDEIEVGHSSEDKDSEVTKHFDDNESEETCDFENKSGEKTNVLANNVKTFTFIDDKIEDSYAFSGNESEGTRSFKDEMGENTNSIQSNVITINQYCMDDKSEKSHIFISDSDTTHDFEDNKDEETSIDFTKDGIHFPPNYENDKQQKDDNTYTYKDIDSEKIKQNEIRKNKIKMSQNLSEFFSLYTNIEAPFDSKILISSDDENEVTCIKYNENRTKKNTKENENDIIHVPHCTYSEVNHNLENNAFSDGESEKTQSFNESEKTRSFNASENTRSFNESENDQNHVFTKTVTEVGNYGNIENYQINSTHTILNNENDCILIISDGESERTHNFNDNNSEGTKEFNDNESVETRNFENISGEKTNLLNNDDKACTSRNDKSEDPYTFIDNESVGTHSFKGEFDGNINKIQSNDITLKLNWVDDESEKSLICIDSHSDTTHNFEDQKAGNTIDFTENQSTCSRKFEKDEEQIDDNMFQNDDNETAQAEENTNINNIPNYFDPEDDSTRSFNGSEVNNKNEIGKNEFNIFQDEMSTDSFQSSSDIEIIL